MSIHSSSNLPGGSPPNPSSSNPKRRNRRRSKKPFVLEESPVDTMADQRTMAELLRAPTEGYVEAIVVPSILAEQFELKHSLINMMTSDQYFGLEKDNPHDHIRWFNKITSTIKYKDVPNSVIKLMLFPFSLAGAARRTTNLRNEILNFQQRFDESFHEAWDRYKDLLRACPHYGFTELHQLDTFYNALNPADQDSLNSAAGGNLLERRTQDVLTIIENKSKQTSFVTTAMTAILKQVQATPPPASVKAIKEICVTCGGAHPYYQCLAAGGKTFLELRDNIQGYVLAAAVNYNQGNFGYRPPGVANQIRPSGFAQPNVQNNQNRFSQPLGYKRGKNFNQDQSYQAPTKQNQVVPLSELEKIKRMNEANMKAMQTQINNMKNELRNEMKNLIQASMSNQTNELKNMMASFFQMNIASTSEETLTDQDLAEYTIKVPPPLVQKPKPHSQINFVVHQRDPLHPNIPYPLRMHKQKQQEKDEKMLGLPELISTRMTLELPNRAICALAGIARDVFVLVGKFTFLADFVIVDYESDPRVPLILGRTFLRTARDLIDVHGEEMILCDGDERLTLNMRHDTSSYSNQPQKELINMINIFNDSCEDFPENLFETNHQSGNPTFSPHLELTSPEAKDDIFDPEGGNVLIKKVINLDSTKDLLPPYNVNPLSGSTTFSSSSNHLLEEFTDELALITFPPGNDDLPFDIGSDLKEIEYLLNNDPIKEIDSILEDLVDEDTLADLNDNLADIMPEMFTDEHAFNYSFPLLYDEYDNDLFEVESNTEYVYDDPFDSKEEKIKESKLLIDELDLLRSSDFLPSPEHDSFLFEDFSKVDAFPLTDNKDKVFNPGILIQKNLSEVNTRVAPDKNVKKIAISHASLILEDFDPPLYKLPFLKEVPGSETLLSLSSENEEKVFKPRILTSKGVQFSLIPKISHRGHKVFKIIKILESLMEIFPCFCRENIHILDVHCLHFYPL
uniref:Retrotransposon gag domain-containing protein n=1 Tax=Tanacetum cinerariifolium TaxID=118510 RepID=A0A6L2K6Z9_TANCI|nr:hypothetical protein [Tanacetum cinerariifolium]